MEKRQRQETTEEDVEPDTTKRVKLNDAKPSNFGVSTEESTKKPSKVGIIYVITCVMLVAVYIGQTTMSIGRRFSSHRGAAKKGKKGLLYEALRTYARDQFQIKLLQTRPIPDGVNSRKFLNPYEKEEMQQHMANGGSLLNTDKGTDESRKVTTQKMLETRKQRNFGKVKTKNPLLRGSVAKHGNSWRFRYYLSGKEHRENYKTQELAIEAQDKQFPINVTALTESKLKVSFAYKLHHPNHELFYIGITTNPLQRRLGGHLSDATNEMTEFHRFIKQNEPNKWLIEPIYTLYNITNTELRIVEEFLIAKYQVLGKIWNESSRPKPQFQQIFRYTETKSRKEKCFSVGVNSSIDEINTKQQAEEHKQEREREKVFGTITFSQKWFGEFQINDKKTLKKSVNINSKYTSEEAKEKVNIWLHEKITEHDKWVALQAQIIIQNSSELFTATEKLVKESLIK